MFYQLDIDPILFSIGPIAIRWYGLMYLAALSSAYFCAYQRAKISRLSAFTHVNSKSWENDDVSDLLFLGFIGAVLGGRVGYMFFYNFKEFIANPITLFGWTGSSIEWSGMSFHGGLLGVILVFIYYARKNKRTFFEVSDFIAPTIPLGLLFGRIGNFINGELWGRSTCSDWGFIFKYAPDVNLLNSCNAEQIKQLANKLGDNINLNLRHPSQLYEAFLEGLVLFIILWIYSKKPKPTGAVSGVFLIGYGAFRFIVEFFREPDNNLFIAFGWLTRGMLLCLPMLIIGAIFIAYAYCDTKTKAAS